MVSQPAVDTYNAGMHQAGCVAQQGTARCLTTGMGRGLEARQLCSCCLLQSPGACV
jgi:hypothetical protein